MKVGKIPETVLKRSVLKQLKHRRSEILVCPGIGEDCSALQISGDEVLVLSTDPITGTANEIGKLAVHITANDIASSGAELIGIMMTIILPDGFSESKLRGLIIDIENECAKLNMEVMGGHTEVSKAVIKPIVTITGVGKIKKNDLILTGGLKPTQELVMTKWTGLEGTAIIAAEKEEELSGRYPSDLLETAKSWIDDLSIVKEAMIGKKVGVSAMHDVTEGGLFGALWEMAAASKVGIEVDLKKIPIRQETIEICEFYDINPYMLISSGCLLMGTCQGNNLVEMLKKEGIAAAIIGKVTQGNDRILINNEERRFLEPPKSDELYKVLGR